MPLKIKTADEIVAAVQQHLRADETIYGQLADIPYLAVHALTPGQPPGSANWALGIAGSCSAAMTGAIRRAEAAVQSEAMLQAQPLGLSAFGG